MPTQSAAHTSSRIQYRVLWVTFLGLRCGPLAFMVFEGKFKASVLVTFLQRLLKQVAGKIYLLVDGHPVHKSGAAKHSSRLRLIRLPGYCPELNPDELLNQDVKTNGLGKSRPTNRTELLAIVRRHL